MNLMNLMQRCKRWLTIPSPTPASSVHLLANHQSCAHTGRLYVRRAARWHSGGNPLRGLTIERAVSLAEAGERGDYAGLQWLYRSIEKRDATLCALLSRYDGGLLKLDWQIKQVDSSETPPLSMPQAGSAATRPGLAAAQAAALREAYTGVDNLRAAIQFLVMARFRGFAHLEKWRDAQGRLTHLEPVPQWHWTRPGINGGWAYNADPWRYGPRASQPISADRFVIREQERPVDEIALFIHVRRNQCQRDWDAFVETYGVPAMFVIGPAGASQETEEELTARIEAVISNSRGYLPYGTQLESVPTEARGVNPFRTYLKALDEALVLAATGGKLSVLAEPGVGQQAGFVHWRVWREIIQAEAMLISEVFQQQLDAPLLASKFPGQPLLAYFELCANEETDVGAVVEHALRLRQAGYQIDPAELSEKTGYRLRLTTSDRTRHDTPAPHRTGPDARETAA